MENDYVKKVIKALVQYGINVQACVFYIKKSHIVRFSLVDSDLIAPILEELENMGCITIKKDIGTYLISLKVKEIEKKFPKYCYKEIKTIYKYSVTYLGMSKYQLSKKEFELMESLKKNTEKTKWLAKFSEERYIKRTPEERVFSKYLSEHYADFQEQVPIITRNGNCYILDYLVDQSICLELDGEYHKGIAEMDRRRDRDLKEFGIETLRITNDEMKKMLTLEDIISPMKTK